MRRTEKYGAVTKDEAERSPSALLRAVSMSNGRWTFYEAVILEKGERVESVSFNARLQGSSGIVYPIWIGIHRTTNEWKGDKLTWNNQPGFEDELLGITPYYAGEPGHWAYWELDLKRRDFNEEHLSIIMVLEEEVTSEISFTMNPFLIFITYR